MTTEKEHFDELARQAQYPRVRIKKGWEGAGRWGTIFYIIHRNAFIGQAWAMVLWDDEEDPDCHKTAGLEYADGQDVGQ